MTFRSISEGATAILDGSVKFSLCRLGGIQEASFDSDNRTVKVVVIQAGWSKNKVYYPTSVLPEIKEFLDTTAEKVYIDHTSEGANDSRKMVDWVANVKETEIVGDKLYANIYVHEEGPNAWVYERMRKSPEGFGPSIVGMALIKEGKAEGKQGKIVKSVKFIRSFDIVSTPAAGGSIGAPVSESILWNAEDEVITEGNEQLTGYIKKLKDREKEYQAREKMWTLTNAFTSMLCDIIFAENDYEFISVKDRKKLLSPLGSDMVAEVSKLPFKAPKKKDAIKAKEEYREMVDNDNEQIQENVNQNNNIEESEMDIKTLSDLKNAHPTLVSELKEEVKNSLKTENTSAAMVSENDRLTKENETLTARVKKLDDDSVTLTEENKTLTAKVTEADQVRIVACKKEAIDKVVKEAELPENAVTDVFSETLNSVPYEVGKEKEFEESIKALCDDRKTLVSEATKNKPVIKTGSVNSPKKKTEKVSEEEKHPVSNEQFANAAML